MSNIMGECKDCGLIFDITLSLACPACRAARVAETFAPIDPMRTALGMLEHQRKPRIGNWNELSPKQRAEINDQLDSMRYSAGYLRGSRFNDDPLPNVPEDCNMPTDEAGQIYELKRLFRL